MRFKSASELSDKIFLASSLEKAGRRREIYIRVSHRLHEQVLGKNRKKDNTFQTEFDQ